MLESRDIFVVDVRRDPIKVKTRDPRCTLACTHIADGKLTYHLPHLDLRKSDHPELVEAVIRGANNDPRNRTLTVLIVVWRLRNKSFSRSEMSLSDQGEARQFKSPQRRADARARRTQLVGLSRQGAGSRRKRPR